MAADLPKVVQERLQPEFWYRRANIPREYQGTDLRWYDDSLGAGGDLRTRVEEYLERMLGTRGTDDAAQGLAVFGPPGVAKTHLACFLACARVYVDVPLTSYAKLFSHEPSAYFITADGFNQMNLEIIQAEKRADRVDADDDIVERWWRLVELRNRIFTDVPLLVFDDVGKEHRTATGYASTNFHRLLRQRYFAGLATVMTSNLGPTEYIKAYGEASMSFLKQACSVVPVSGSDVRGRR